MSEENFKVLNYNNTKLIISGLGRLFYETGFPLSISLDECSSKGIHFNIYTLLDELSEEWSKDTIIKKLKEESIEVDYDKVIEFLNSSYVEQRNIIFGSLLLQTGLSPKELFDIIIR